MALLLRKSALSIMSQLTVPPSLYLPPSFPSMSTFPLVNRPRGTIGTSTPSGSTNPSLPTSNPGEILRRALTTGMVNIGDGSEELAEQPSPVSMLHSDDRIPTDGLVTNVGKCMLGWQEKKRTSEEHQVWRKRLWIAYNSLDSDESLLK